ncbi:3-oxoacyl-[acyl-carrier protein] reductase [Capronia coronata CBS 617.96]|uniref:3-oxoacyl-[acyl-carrier protein] reductase n=1 Tax=Capronia coronata CBS 617.96 TaxID=1182541 RepID=W9YRQ5_9EURO|nr:3-oxoacyl-[acyl-carrier protein] reductase [Capronia coronata CBS 617.96]EXJ95253.1 3-oxoacyl-[acyl-carrier protein] reductase [Capronia coronata CBS 617.96]
MPSTLIVGATRGLGKALVTYYAERLSYTVYATSRSSDVSPSLKADNVSWLTGIDLSKPSCGKDLASSLKGKTIDTCIVTAGYFVTEDFGEAKWDEEIKMYTLSSVAPVFVVQELVKASILSKGSKVVLVSSESGSITLRHEQEGGGNYGHHGSKAALNMVAKQLSFDLKDEGVAVVSVHPSFMRTEMTKGVGFDKFWDAGGALKPEEAARILGEWVEKEFSLDKTGTYWAPRGTQDIGNWDVVMGKETAKDGPVQLPW